MKRKNLILAASVAAFAGLCSFKAGSTNSDVLAGKTKQITSNEFSKMFAAKNATIETLHRGTPGLVVTVVLYALATSTPTYGFVGFRDSDDGGGNISQKKRLKGLDAK